MSDYLDFENQLSKSGNLDLENSLNVKESFLFKNKIILFFMLRGQHTIYFWLEHHFKSFSI